ncbi:MAG: TolC family protein [Chitinophagales bacterium]|nr:TolC family protein [Bacteroidota bacterium]MCB9043730.1 TolC family protein [Chitinophagales bacterium]
MKFQFFIFFIIGLHSTYILFSQITTPTIFTYNEFIENIIKYHPISKQTELRLVLGQTQFLKAQGNFDPLLYAEWSEKNFNEKLYYQQYAANLRIPTLMGIDIVGGYENSRGDYLNPENSTSSNGLWHLGIEIDVLQGLIINERKTTLQQAKLFRNLTNNEQQILLNELIFNASYAYLQWQLYYNFDEVLKENVTLANNYLYNTKQSFLGGEKTAVDTLEAYILYQDASIEQQKNYMQLIQAKLFLENFLWYNDKAIGLSDNTQPEDFQNTLLNNPPQFVDSLSLNNNPSILSTINKLSMLEIEQKLKREKLKPKLKLKYNPLLSPSTNDITPTYSLNNYTWGFVFSMPLFLRKERADVREGNVKIEALTLELANKQNELLNKIENTVQQQLLLKKQQSLFNLNVVNYKSLLDAENEKFLFGESSVFLLNKRQEKYINARLKLIENQIKLNIEYIKYLYYTNTLVN